MAALKTEPNPADRPISYYPDGWASMLPVDSTLSRMHRGVQNGQWKTDIDRLRKRVADKNAKGEDGKPTAAAKRYKNKKNKLSYFTAGGKFKPGSGGRKKGQFHDSTGIRFLELDGETTAAAMRDSLRELPYVVAAWVSSSGMGVHMFALQDPPMAGADDDHASWQALADAIERDTGILVNGDEPGSSSQDGSVRDCTRGAYVSHDPDAWINPDAVPLQWTPPAPAPDGNAKRTGTLADARAELETFDASSMDYNHWLGWVTAMKEAGFSLAEAEAWSSRSTKHTNGYLAGEWDGLPANAPPDEACGNILGFAIKNHAFKGKGKGKAQAKLQDWHEYGEHLGKARYQGKYRFDSERDEWWRWAGTSWTYAKGDIPAGIARDLGKNRVELDKALDEFSATYRGKDGEENRVLCLTERNLNTHRPQGIARGLQVALDRPFPDYSVDQAAKEARSRLLATPSGVVDLVTGAVEPHDPLRHDTRAVTTGDYNPDDTGEAEAMLRKRLALVFDNQQFTNYKKYLGMTVSGEGQSFRGVILCQGGAGSGKGGLNGLQAAAWGRRAHVLPMSMLERATQEIDVTRYALLRDQPLFLLLDENGAVNTSTLNSITGNNPLPAARLPYMAWGYEDTIPSVVWWTTIETPALRRRTGIDRRMGYLAFENEIPDAAKDATQFFPQALLDAMVTVGVQQAMLWRKREISDPNVQLPDVVTADMDPVQQAISALDPEVWAGEGVSQAREHVAKVTGDQRITATSFGNAVSVNDVWRKQKETAGEHRNKWILKLKR